MCKWTVSSEVSGGGSANNKLDPFVYPRLTRYEVLARIEIKAEYYLHAA
jgi:hypothetical protein